MRNLREFAIQALSVAVACTLGWQACAQAPTSDTTPDDNPAVANCNMTPDTQPDPHDPRKRIATPIDSTLLTLGQPCQQKVRQKRAKHRRVGQSCNVASTSILGSLSSRWNSPADGKTIGQGPRPGGDAVTTWEALSNYRPLAAVMLDKGSKPTWGSRIVPDLCKPFDGPNKIVLQLGEAAWNQPFKTGPLIDQNGNYALFDILMNKPMFDFIENKGLYSKQGQERFDSDIKSSHRGQSGRRQAGTDGRGHVEGVMAHPRP